jgi:hypothetical protein
MIVHAILHLQLLFVGAIFLAGIMGVLELLRGGPFAELWICAPPALLIAILLGYGFFCWRRRLRQRLQWYSYDSGVLDYETREGSFTREISDIVEVSPEVHRRGPDSYRIRFHDGRWVILAPETENGAALVEQLRRDGGLKV